MSKSYFDSKQYWICDIIRRLDVLIESKELNYSEKTFNIFKATSFSLKLYAEAVHRIEQLVDGHENEEEFHIKLDHNCYKIIDENKDFLNSLINIEQTIKE